MAPFKKNLTPLTKGGKIEKHTGKGSEQSPMPDRQQIGKLARGGSMNDYAKATPMPTPMFPGSPSPGSGF